MLSAKAGTAIIMNAECRMQNVKWLTVVAFIIFNFTFLIPIGVYAVEDNRPFLGPEPNPAGSTSATSSVVGLPNPLGTSDPAVIIGRIIRTFTGFAGGIGLLMFVYGGFIWLTSFGNPERIKKGQDLLLWTTIGLAIMFSSYIVARYIITAVTRGTGTL